MFQEVAGGEEDQEEKVATLLEYLVWCFQFQFEQEERVVQDFSKMSRDDKLAVSCVCIISIVVSDSTQFLE